MKLNRNVVIAPAAVVVIGGGGAVTLNFARWGRRCQTSTQLGSAAPRDDPPKAASAGSLQKGVLERRYALGPKPFEHMRDHAWKALFVPSSSPSGRRFDMNQCRPNSQLSRLANSPVRPGKGGPAHVKPMWLNKGKSGDCPRRPVSFEFRIRGIRI
jgi:hypothetical protein